MPKDYAVVTVFKKQYNKKSTIPISLSIIVFDLETSYRTYNSGPAVKVLLSGLASLGIHYS